MSQHSQYSRYPRYFMDHGENYLFRIDANDRLARWKSRKGRGKDFNFNFLSAYSEYDCDNKVNDGSWIEIKKEEYVLMDI